MTGVVGLSARNYPDSFAGAMQFAEETALALRAEGPRFGGEMAALAIVRAEALEAFAAALRRVVDAEPCRDCAQTALEHLR